MTMTNNLIGETSVDRSLMNLGYSSRPSPKSERTSRFWFKVAAIEDETKIAKSKLAKKTREHVDQDVVDRLSTYRNELPPLIANKLEAVREFFLTEIAPLTLASSGGTLQSKEVVERLLDTPVDTALLGRFEGMVNRAATLKLAMFVLKYFDLPSEHLNALLGTPNVKDDFSKVLDAMQGLATKGDTALLRKEVGQIKAHVRHSKPVP